MNRRTFLKKVGLVVCGVSSLGVIGEPAQKVWSRTIFKRMFKEGDIPAFANDNLFGTKVIEHCGKWLLPPTPFEPIEIDGQKYFVAMMHPQQEYDLRVMAARDKYKHESHVERYNRWALGRGFTPYVEIEGELGSFYA